MLTTKSEFRRRLIEINLYFNTLLPLDDCLCVIESQTIKGEIKRTLIDTELNKILKANGFILLYNLLESTIRHTIRAIGNKISDDGLTYQNFSENLKRLWINYTFRYNEKQTDKHKFISPILQKIVNNEFLKFEEESVSISGNIDARKVRDIARRIGYKEPKDGESLLMIKEKRNQLAHGEKTFGEIGRDISVKQLIEMKDAMVDFIEEVLNNVQVYIENREYYQP